MEKAVTRIKKTRTSVPSNLRQANILLGELGQTQDSINEIEKELAEKVAELKAKAAKKLEPLALKRSNQINALFTFANPRKAELTREVRSVTLDCGVFGWRWTPPRVEMDQSDEVMIAELKKIGEGRFVRVIEEVDRQALLVERALIPGIRYLQDDEFFVVPKQKCKKAKTFTQAVDR